MAKYNTLSGAQVIASQNANEVDLPPPGRFILFRNNSDGKIYYKASDGRIFPLAPGWDYIGNFSYTAWQPNPGATGSVLINKTLAPYEIVTGITMRINTRFAVGFPSMLIKDDAGNLNLGNPIGMGAAGSLGKTATKFVTEANNVVLENTRILSAEITTAVGTIDGMGSGNFDLWLKTETVNL